MTGVKKRAAAAEPASQHNYAEFTVDSHHLAALHRIRTRPAAADSTLSKRRAETVEKKKNAKKIKVPSSKQQMLKSETFDAADFAAFDSQIC